MNIRFFYLIVLLVFLFNSCDESSTSVFLLSEEDFTSEMNDSIVVYIESEGPDIELKGELDLIEGECNVWLTYPIYDTVFFPDTVYISDTIFNLDSIYLGDSIFSVDSIFIIDTLYFTDTILNARVIYNEVFETSDDFSIDEKFTRIKGEWVFRYQLIAIDDVDPSGSFEFNITYKN